MMLYSNTCAYAIRAMGRLAALRPKGYVLLEELCADGDLPRHFLAKILQQLVHHGLLVSAKGRGGGFALARPAERITLYDIVTTIDGTEPLNQCIAGMARCDDEAPCPQHQAWKPLRQAIQDFLAQTTLKEMSETLRQKDAMLSRPNQPGTDRGDAASDPNTG
jgi:Rrf2 family protein